MYTHNRAYSRQKLFTLQRLLYKSNLSLSHGQGQAPNSHVSLSSVYPIHVTRDSSLAGVERHLQRKAPDTRTVSASRPILSLPSSDARAHTNPLHNFFPRERARHATYPAWQLTAHHRTGKWGNTAGQFSKPGPAHESASEPQLAASTPVTVTTATLPHRQPKQVLPCAAAFFPPTHFLSYARH